MNKKSLTDEEKRIRNVENQRRWRKQNPEKIKAHKRRYHERTYVKKLTDKPYDNEKEHRRLRKRLDALFIVDGYLKENIARRMKINVSEVPDEILEACRALLQLKREIRRKK
jgi:hypothetical protein